MSKIGKDTLIPFVNYINKKIDIYNTYVIIYVSALLS